MGYTSAIHSHETIFAEHFRGENLRQIDIDRFRDQGVPAMALVRTGIMLRQRIVFCQGGRFEFERYRCSDEAAWAFIIPCHDASGDLLDLVAWRPPSIVATWLGRASLLDEDQVLGPRLDDHLVVHEDIMSWLRAYREGVVVFDMKRASPLLRDAAPLMVSRLEHGQQLRKALALPAPRIVVQVTAAEARAA